MRLTQLWLYATLFVFSTATLAAGQDATQDKPAQKADDQQKDTEKSKDDEGDAKEDLYTIPDDADAKQLVAIIDKVKGTRPNNLQEFLKGLETMEKASARILEEVKDKDSAEYDAGFTTSLFTQVVRLQVPGGGDVDIKKLYGEAKEYLTAKKELSPEQAQIAAGIPNALEQTDRKLAAEAYATFGKLLSEQKNPQFAQFGKIMIGSGRRLNLVGSDMKVSGTTFAGDEFKLGDLKGKVVLVDFWATWCGPCLREIPNIKAAYEKYHDKGFEVVGISIDEDRAALEKFMAENELPWIVLHEKGPGNNPVAEYYGVNAIPFMVLVGKDQKVISIAARGPALEQLLDRLLGE